MKKLYMLCLTLLLILSFSSTALAYQAPGAQDPAPEVVPSDPDPGGGEPSSGGDSGGGGGEDVTPTEPQILSYTPVVTALHSVNAAFIENNEAVYFLPALEDFPVNLADTCSDLTTDDGKQHKFAIVYDGYFDTEVVYNQAVAEGGDTGVSRLQTSKKVFSATDNSRCLNLLGYDLLLADEHCSIVQSNGFINFQYSPTIVGSNYLTAKTCIMDLYKAVGAYEWDIKVTYGKDISDLAVNTSPLMQQLEVLTNDLVEGGIDTEEGACWVWASRTNPDQYWARCQRDAIFDGGAHTYTKANYIGNETSCTFSKNETDTVTFAEFCVMARAIMNLYGEPVVTEREIQEMIQLYAVNLPNAAFNQEQREAIEYLAAKGIIDPSTTSFTDRVTFADIEEILLRIADVDSRLIVRSDANFQNALVQNGFVETNVSGFDIPLEGVEEITNPYDDEYYDYFVEAVDGFTNFTVRKINQTDYTNNTNVKQVVDPTKPPTTTLEVDTKTSDGKDLNQFLFACDSLRVRTPGTGEGTTSGSGYFTYEGMEEINGDYYYHFRISREITEVTIYYDTGSTVEGDVTSASGIVKEIQGMTEYTLVNANGGVYNYSEGKEPYQTFDEANYSLIYMDATRFAEDALNLKETESYLSDYHWIMLTIPKSKFTQAGMKDVCYVNPQNNKSICFVDFVTAANNGEQVLEYEDMPGGTWQVYIQTDTTGANTTNVRVLFQCHQSYNEFVANLKNTSKVTMGHSETTAYYKHDDGTLLVSYDYLKRMGLVSSMYKPNENTLILTLSKYANSNITLNNSNKCIVIGDTIMKEPNETLFYETSDNALYINYRACTGWASNYVIVNTDSGVIPVIDSSHITGTKYALNIGTIPVSNRYPNSSYNCAYNKKVSVLSNNQVVGVDANSTGIVMTATNPFGNYIIYESPADEDTDILFMIKRDNLKSQNGSVTSIGSTGDAVNKFEQVTGMSINVPDGFGMYYYYLSKSSPSAGFKNINYTYKSQYNSGAVSLGYVYEPKQYGNITDAINDYVNDTTGSLLPVVKIGQRYFNLNMNTCTLSDYSEQEPLGNLPYILSTTKSYKGGNMGRLEGNGKVEEVTSNDANLDQVTILPAAVGLFGGIKGFPSKDYADVKSNLYYGSQSAKVKSGIMYINGFVKVQPENSVANGIYVTSSSGGMYAVCDGNASILASLFEDPEAPEIIVTEPETLVDWGAYKFNRLVENLDSWSSIALIFILNILPRIAMLLFFVLMLLSLIKDVRPWRIFCQKVFDVYSFLTFGKQNVDTIDMKKVFWTSLICFSIFLVIMDGTLFNIIIWVCRFFVSLWQH